MTTVDIPGGTAELYDPKDLTPRRRIPAKALLYRADALLFKLYGARTIISPTGDVEENPALTGPEVRLTQHEAETLQNIKYASTWGFLKSWTLDRPLPATWEDLLDLPAEIIDPIHDAVENIGKPDAIASIEMSEETLVDEGSFTGSSAASKTSSKGNGKRRSSRRKRTT